jgi:hypothetical protein
MPDQPRFWFPAKRYGWGWGRPTAWQGWGVIACYAMLVAVGVVVIVPSSRPGWFVAYLVFVSLLLLAVCRAKGEPPRWRWGERNRR